MAKESGVKAAKGILYVLSRIAIVVVIIVIAVIAFYTAMHTMNVEMVLKDAYTARAQAVLLPSKDGSEDAVLQRLFTADFLANDTELNGDRYSEFDILNYYQRTEVDSFIIWPWEDEATVKVTDIVTEITGTPLDMIAEDGTIISSEEASEKPPEWKNGQYEVKLLKRGNAWMVTSQKLLKEVEPEPTGALQPSASASPRVSASGEPSDMASPADTAEGAEE